MRKNPSGKMNFISECRGISDKTITYQSGFVDLLEQYEAVLADYEFPIREKLTIKRATCWYHQVDMVLTKWHLKMFTLQNSVFTLNYSSYNMLSNFFSTKYPFFSCIILITLSKFLLACVACTLDFLVLMSKTKIRFWKIYSMRNIGIKDLSIHTIRYA